MSVQCGSGGEILTDSSGPGQIDTIRCASARPRACISTRPHRGASAISRFIARPLSASNFFFTGKLSLASLAL